MKVDVTIIRKPAVKVEVTLARAKRRGCAIPVPVRVASQDNEDYIEDCDIATAEAEEELDEEPVDEAFTLDDEAEEIIEEDESAEYPEEDIDEDDLLALIAEEEAEMAAQGCCASSEADIADEEYDGEEYIAEESAEEAFADEPELSDEQLAEIFDGGEIAEEDVSGVLEDGVCTSDEAQELVDELAGCEDSEDDSGVLDDGVCTSDEAQELADELFTDEGDDDDSFDKYGGAKTDEPAAAEQYVRYFDRGSDGQRVEVQDSNATGQEIVCVDGDSGKISRVCGFIKHDKPQQVITIDDLPPVDEDQE